MSRDLGGKKAARHYVDQRSLPEWGIASDGRSVRLVPDEQMHADYALWQAAECIHPDIVIHKRVNAGGSEMYKRMCRNCGVGVGEWIKHADISGETVSTDPIERFENCGRRYADARMAELEGLANAAAERQQPARRGEYSDYLTSEVWQRKRELIFKRAGGICEGCLSRPATQVHHLSYEHIRKEFAFELVAICDACHDRLHKCGGA